MIDQEILSLFIDEANDSLAKFESNCLALFEDITKVYEVESIYRTLHNLKGTSKALGLDEYGNFIHLVEDALLPYKQNEKEPNQQIISILLEIQETLMGWIKSISDSEANELSFNTSNLIQKLNDLDNNENLVSKDHLFNETATQKVEKAISEDVEDSPSTSKTSKFVKESVKKARKQMKRFVLPLEKSTISLIFLESLL